MNNDTFDIEKLFTDAPDLLGLLSKTSDPFSEQPSIGSVGDEPDESIHRPSEKPDVKPQSKGGKFGRIVFNFLFYALVVAIISGGAIFALSNDTQKSYFGYRLYTVKTPSMTPKEDGSSLPGGFRAGDIILVKLCEPDTVQAGDIVTYVPGSDPNVYLTHRVVEVLDHLNDNQGIFFITRGDANDSDDPPVKGDAVVGKKVLVIPGTGFILEFIRDNFILSIIIIVSGIGFVILLRMYFSNPGKKAKKKRQHACTQ